MRLQLAQSGVQFPPDAPSFARSFAARWRLAIDRGDFPVPPSSGKARRASPPPRVTRAGSAGALAFTLI